MRFSQAEFLFINDDYKLYCCSTSGTHKQVKVQIKEKLARLYHMRNT